LSRRHLLRNVRAVLANPAMGVAYARWLVGRLHGGPVITTHFGATLGDFENFSNFWGTIAKLPKPEHFDFFASFLEGDNPVCFDVGANIGSFALILARRCPACTIHAFEPAAGTFRILNSNVKRNQGRRVYAQQLAIADCDETVRFSNDPRISQNNRILTRAADDGMSCEVRATSLDAFCSVHDIGKIDFIKIDCEGVEPLVLRGARRLLREQRIRAALVEVAPRNLQAYAFTIADLCDALAGTPYAFHRLEEYGAPGPCLTADEMAVMGSEDLLLLPR
jgi:FkbM family methyltransferase